MISSDSFEVDVCNQCGLLGYSGWYVNCSFYFPSICQKFRAVLVKVYNLPTVIVYNSPTRLDFQINAS